ncbi:alpha/beta hydrolase [Amycolatopsis sp. WAC 01416]|uniref:alpha/beta fold hydrolase n=1 Tax=Amycolatopsis sp. WAC 01416 TaxID=2203196 RepID=UPI000F7991DD|nr:alpha/beta hydrolase [Amycolatopsis sp. WAC 01416]RSN23646.1 alpha/beta hydrolase [Amycolatopsis sp. WAC 01416]
MPEMIADVNGVELCHETFGPPDGRPLLMIMGLASQMIWWDDELCENLAAEGFFVIRYDNRDAGRSSRMTGRASLPLAYALRTAPYSLADMAGDAAGLLTKLGVESAHVVGASMGGMVAQTLAVEYPSRVRSLTSIMSTTGNRFVGRPSAKAMAMLLSAPPRDRAQYVESLVRTFRVIGSPGYPFDEARMRERAERSFDRGVNPGGTARQLAAIVSSRDRFRALRKLDVPALVVHGSKDPLVHVSGGRATARALRKSEVDIVPGMGHDLPRAIWPRLTRGLLRTADRADVKTRRA